MERADVQHPVAVRPRDAIGECGERLGDVWQTYRFLVSLSLLGVQDVSVFPFSPYPGSELFEFVRRRGDVALGDRYFLSLSQYTDPHYTKSYCENLSPFVLRLLCLAGMGLFYLVNYARHPARLARLVRNVFFRRDPKTKLESALVRVIKKREKIREYRAAAAV